MRDEFSKHRYEMDKIRRRGRAVFGAMFLMMIIIGLGSAWILAHPRVIGAYLNEVAAGFEGGER